MQIKLTSIPGVLVLIPDRHTDERGYFAETWNKIRLAEIGIAIEFVQDNHSLSTASNTLRGLHFQCPPHAQTKLVRCGQGSLFDVVVDIRRGSPTFGFWTGAELSAENGQQMLVPEGFAHGFVTREPDTEIVYKCSAYHAPKAEGEIRWDSCGIDWGIDGDPILSMKDADAPAFVNFESPFNFESSN